MECSQGWSKPLQYKITYVPQEIQASLDFA
jgi:hypothetical protein